MIGIGRGKWILYGNSTGVVGTVPSSGNVGLECLLYPTWVR